MRARYDSRFAIGPLPFSGAGEAESGGWIRLAPGEADDDVVDEHLLAAFTDFSAARDLNAPLVLR